MRPPVVPAGSCTVLVAMGMLRSLRLCPPVARHPSSLDTSKTSVDTSGPARLVCNTEWS